MMKVLCIVAMVAIAFLLAAPSEALPVDMDATTEAVVNTGVKHCFDGSPCGWAVYGKDSTTKKTKLYIKNTCVCKPESSCNLTNEDIAITAFVYRCVKRKVEETTENP